MAHAIRKAAPADHAEWLRLRCALWPDCPAEEHVCEMANIMTRLADQVVFVVERADGRLAGFIEASIHATAAGCETSPVGYVEGWYVDPDTRRSDIGRALMARAEEWAVERGCREMASDALPENGESIAAHKACGYAEVERLVHFRKSLVTSAASIVADGSGI
ncbi:MAG: aminoglycoside 6'-acetyltransferase [Planctomycetota bacterium]|nr:MAG: aminoglycoside 6'-acetyltransferase [Planctomycetota bacterium]